LPGGEHKNDHTKHERWKRTRLRGSHSRDINLILVVIDPPQIVVVPEARPSHEPSVQES
jgi:hypothetical protein